MKYPHFCRELNIPENEANGKQTQKMNDSKNPSNRNVGREQNWKKREKREKKMQKKEKR